MRIMVCVSILFAARYPNDYVVIILMWIAYTIKQCNRY